MLGLNVRGAGCSVTPCQWAGVLDQPAGVSGQSAAPSGFGGSAKPSGCWESAEPREAGGVVLGGRAAGEADES